MGLQNTLTRYINSYNEDALTISIHSKSIPTEKLLPLIQSPYDDVPALSLDILKLNKAYNIDGWFIDHLHPEDDGQDAIPVTLTQLKELDDVLTDVLVQPANIDSESLANILDPGEGLFPADTDLTRLPARRKYLRDVEKTHQAIQQEIKLNSTINNIQVSFGENKEYCPIEVTYKYYTSI